MKPLAIRLAFALCLIFTSPFAGFVLNAESFNLVTQKGRAFNPRAVEVKAGEQIVIENDDQYVHHVFVDNAQFKFDSGEQKIGQTVSIVFSRPGDYVVLCAIHPKMRLNVTVK